MLQQQLDRVALMIEQSPHFSNLEAYVWRRLSQYVDASHFERTGQIIAPVVAPDRMAGEDETTHQHYSEDDVQKGLESLISSGHITLSRRAKQPDHYRLVLPQSLVSSDQTADS